MRPARHAIRTLAALGLTGTMLAGAAAATEPIGDQFRISNQLPDGNAAIDAAAPATAYNTTTNQYLTVWEGETDTAGEHEIFARITAADGSPVGAPARISDMGPDGDAAYDALRPAVAYDPDANQYLVTWEGDDDTGALADGEFEIHGQLLAADGAEIGGDIRLSDMGADGGTGSDASASDVTYNAVRDEYLVAWSGDDADGEFEIYVQRVSGDGVETGTDTRISDMGPDGSTAYGAANPAIAHNRAADQYMVLWQGDDDTGPLVDNETEVFAQRLDGTAAEIGADTRVTNMGPDGDLNYGAALPDVVHNAVDDEFLAVWQGDDDTAPLVNNEIEVFATRLSAAGAGVGEVVRVSDMGPDGSTAYGASEPAVAHNPAGGEYIVVWQGDDDTAPLVDGETEIFAQRLDTSLAEVEGDTRISQMGPDGDAGYAGAAPGAAYNAAENEYLTVWEGDDDAGALVSGELEIYARRIQAGTPPITPPGTPPGGGIPGTDGAPSAPNCREVATVTGAGPTGILRLSATQLRINQRIGQAAVRRANAVQNWLDAGIVNGDICGGGLTERPLEKGVSVSKGLLGPVPPMAAPRPIVIPAAADKQGVSFGLTAAQLKINQNVYSAAVRRANALKIRLAGNLTGGDIRDGQLKANRLRQDLKLGALVPAASVPAASTTPVAAATATGARFTPTLRQLRINQKIAQAAVRRTNELRAALSSGLTAENFAEGSITAADWAAS